jgi:DNA-directed RNA polymerase specialized sigma24 family protein
MTEGEDTAPGADEKALLRLMQEHFLVGLVRQMRRAYPNAGLGQLEDAVAEAVHKLVLRLRKGTPVRDVPAYLVTIAHNEFKRAAARANGRELPLDDRPEGVVDSAEREALRDAALTAINTEIRSWENANMREVMLVYVEAISYGEPIEADEVAELVSGILGEQLSPNSVRVWKMRGFRRLRDFVEGTDWVQGRRTGGRE